MGSVGADKIGRTPARVLQFIDSWHHPEGGDKLLTNSQISCTVMRGLTRVPGGTMGAERRQRGASALVLLCAMAVLTAPGLATGTAYAAPAPAVPATPAAPAPEPGAKSLEQVRKEIEDLYHQAGAATDAYNLAEAEAKAQSDKIVEIANLIVASTRSGSPP